MKTLQIINPPFQVQYSSCSTYTPRTFRWSNEPSEFGTVYTDNDIPGGAFLPGKKFAWLVESPALTKPVIDYIRANRKLVAHCYKALFTCDTELVGLEPNFFYCPPGSNLPWLPIQPLSVTKNKMCSMFASTKRYAPGHFYREVIAERFQDKMDLFGGTLGSPRLGGYGIHPNKRSGLENYRFSITIENCIYDKYYTEKLTDCFVTGTIPIYWGTSKVVEDFNQDGIIFLGDNFDISCLTHELYLSKLSAIQDNFLRVQHLQMADDILFQKVLSL